MVKHTNNKPQSAKKLNSFKKINEKTMKLWIKNTRPRLTLKQSSTKAVKVVPTSSSKPANISKRSAAQQAAKNSQTVTPLLVTKPKLLTSVPPLLKLKKFTSRINVVLSPAIYKNTSRAISSIKLKSPKRPSAVLLAAKLKGLAKGASHKEEIGPRKVLLIKPTTAIMNLKKKGGVAKKTYIGKTKAKQQNKSSKGRYDKKLQKQDKHGHQINTQRRWTNKRVSTSKGRKPKIIKKQAGLIKHRKVPSKVSPQTRKKKGSTSVRINNIITPKAPLFDKKGRLVTRLARSSVDEKLIKALVETALEKRKGTTLMPLSRPRIVVVKKDRQRVRKKITHLVITRATRHFSIIKKKRPTIAFRKSLRALKRHILLRYKALLQKHPRSRKKIVSSLLEADPRQQVTQWAERKAQRRRLKRRLKLLSKKNLRAEKVLFSVRAVISKRRKLVSMLSNETIVAPTLQQAVRVQIQPARTEKYISDFKNNVKRDLRSVRFVNRYIATRELNKSVEVLGARARARTKWQAALEGCRGVCTNVFTFMRMAKLIRCKRGVVAWQRFWENHKQDAKDLMRQLSLYTLAIRQVSLTSIAAEERITTEASEELVRRFLARFNLLGSRIKRSLETVGIIKARKAFETGDLGELLRLERKFAADKVRKPYKRNGKWVQLKPITERNKALIIARKYVRAIIKNKRKSRGIKVRRISFRARKEKREYLQTRSALLKKIANKGRERTKNQKFERKAGFVNYYRYVDGAYNSYWFGKFVNMFIAAGKKRRAISSIQFAVDSLKFSYNVSVFQVLMVTLRKLRPVFKLRTYKVRKGREVKKYPALARVTLLYMYVLIKIKKAIKKDFKDQRAKEIRTFVRTLRNNLKEFITQPRTHQFVKDRRREVTDSVMYMVNRRFNKKKRRK